MWRGLVLGELFVATLWLIAQRLPQVGAAWLAVATLLLALPMSLALWHQYCVHRLLGLHQFAAGRGLYHFASRRALGYLWRAALALALTAATLVQSAFFEPREWLLLALAPPLMAVLRHAVQARAAAQFERPVYRLRWSLWLTSWTVTLLLTALWLALQQIGSAAQDPADFLAQVHAQQSRWTAAPSGAMAWALDLAAWGQATTGALAAASHEPGWWRLLLAVVVAPTALFGQLSLSLAGLSLPAVEVRRLLDARLSDAASLAPLPERRKALWACIAVIAAMLWIQSIALLNHGLQRAASPFAISPVPECERIGGLAYRLNTSRLLDALLAQTRQQLATHQAAACTQLTAIAQRADASIEAYLDWYFSLGAEWLRLAAMLSGDVDLLLQARFQQMVLADPVLAQQLQALQATHERHWQQLDAARTQALQVLATNRLALDERGCRAKSMQAANPGELQFETGRARLAAGSAAGLAAGAIVGQLTAKAMAKASMKTAGKLLLKASSKKLAGKAAAAAAGAAVGSVVPGVGTAVGAVAGLVIGTGIDLAALAAEEHLTRGDMRRDLREAVTDTLQPYREMFGCG